MKPDAAGKVVAGLDPATAQRVLSRMQRTKRAKVLAVLPPELAVSLTKLQIGATP
jgi:flagellar motility protein MotE (MotC chaperone)